MARYVAWYRGVVDVVGVNPLEISRAYALRLPRTRPESLIEMLVL